MGIIKSLSETSDKAVDIGEVYYQKSQEYYKLKVFQQLTLLTGMISKIAIIGSLSFIGFAFIITSGTIALAEKLGSLTQACLILGTAFLLTAFMVYFFRNRIENLIIKKSSKNFFD